MKILLLDNFDSFTYNLVHVLEKISHVNVTVVRNDSLDFDAVKNFDKIVLSPGPGLPTEAGCMMQLIQTFAGKKPILGVCLGHQALALHFGAKLVNLPAVFHGVSIQTEILNQGILFKNMPKIIATGHYHSWVVDELNFPQDLKITAVANQKYIMAFEHKNQNICGVQFHPESILTPLGDNILANWVQENSTQN